MAKFWLLISLVIGGSLQAQEFSQANKLKFAFHRENFFFPLSKISPYPPAASQNVETIYQLSVKISPITIGHSEMSFAYTQSSWWQLWDASRSRPFRETNYMPELFLKFGGANLYAQFGYVHQSNGKEDPASRSWDRVFLSLTYEKKFFRVTLKGWHIVSEEYYGPEYAERLASMMKFYGYQSLDLAFRSLGIVWKGYGRYSLSGKKGYVKAMALRELGKGIFYGFFMARGYGNSLRTYATNTESYGFGLVINP